MGMSMIKRLEIIFETKEEIDAEGIISVLDSIDLKYKSMKRVELEGLPRVIKQEGCCGQGEKKSPSMLKKIKNYKETMIRWYTAGRPVVSVSVLADRLMICSGCSSLKDYECTECGCPIDTKAKMGIDKLCELNKW